MAKDGKMATMTKRMKSGENGDKRMKSGKNGAKTKRMKSGENGDKRMKSGKYGAKTKRMKSGENGDKRMKSGENGDKMATMTKRTKSGEKRGKIMITRTIDGEWIKYEMSDLVNHDDADADEKKSNENPIIIRKTIIKVGKNIVDKDLPEDVLKFLKLRCDVRDDNKASMEMEEDHQPVASLLPGMTNLGI